MCVTKPLSDAERRLVVELKDGGTIYSETYSPEDDAIDEYGLPIDKEPLIKELLLKENGYKNEDVQKSYISRKKEAGYVYISDHAFLRLKQRNGWGKSASLRMIRKVYDNGTPEDDVRGYVGQWLKQKKGSYGRTQDHFKIYGNYAYAFNGNTLLTVLKIPSRVSIISGLSGKDITEDEY